MKKLVRKKILAEKDRVSVNELLNLSDAFSEMLKSNGGIGLKARDIKKNLEHFAKACVFANQIQVTHDVLVKTVCEKLSAIKGRKVVPRLSQIYGEQVASYLAEGKTTLYQRSENQMVGDAIVAAKTNRFKKLEEDPVFLKSKRKLKDKNFTPFDVAYLRERYIQQTGDLPTWFSKYELTSGGGQHD